MRPDPSFHVVSELVVEQDVASALFSSADGFRDGPYFGLQCAGGNERKGICAAVDTHLVAGADFGEEGRKVA